MEGKIADDNANKQKTEQEFGRAEKIHIYISGTIWLVIILTVVGVIIYGLVSFQLRG